MAAYEPPTQSVPIFDSALFTKEEVDTAEISTTAKNVLFTSDNSNQNCFIPFVKSSGTGTKPLFIDDTTTPITINPNTGDIRMIGLKNDAANNNVGLGNNAGAGQGTNTGCVAIGVNAGQTTQGLNGVAIGNSAGQTGQKTNAVAIGIQAGTTNQGLSAVAIGEGAGDNNTGNYAVSVGYLAGRNQASSSVAIGNSAGRVTQGSSAVAIGREAGETSQGANAVAIGYLAGQSSQTGGSIALNASGVALNPNQVGLFIRPIRGVARGLGVGVLHYDSSTYEVTYSTD
jgi:hypothetical protein